jgi:putative redox protein
MEIKAQLKWTDNLQFVARTGDGPAVIMDSSDSGSGAGPMEMVLMGVAGCTAMDVISIMKKKRANVKGFQTNIIGDRAEEHPRRYRKITIEYIFFGKKIKPNDVERAIELSTTKYCGAMASLNADFEHTYQIVEEEN